MLQNLGGNYARRPLWEVRIPDVDERLLRSTVLERDGGNLWVFQYLDQFDADNPTAAAKTLRKEAIARKRILVRNARRALKKACHTNRFDAVVTREAQAQLPRLHVIEPVVLMAGALAAIGVSNTVLATYVMNGSDLYASDRPGAHFFAALPVLAMLGIKTFERFLVTDTAKSRYAAFFFALGVITFLLWTAAAAMTFAPNASAAAWLTEASNSRWIGAALVLSHVLGDGAWGYLLFRGAEKLLLGNRKRAVLDNPTYAPAVEHAKQAQAALADCLREIGELDDYLAGVALARRELQARAELELDRAKMLWVETQAAGLAYARAHFLNVT